MTERYDYEPIGPDPDIGCTVYLILAAIVLIAIVLGIF